MASFEETSSAGGEAGASEVTAEPVHICATPGCGKPAQLACPTCLKLGLPPTRFCNQDCFKASWNDHKSIHKLIRQTREDVKADPSSMPTEFVGYSFTGSLRPWQKSPRRSVPPGIPRPDYADHPRGIPLSEQQDKASGSPIKVYTADQIAGIREACRIGREVLDLAGRGVGVGVTCDEIDRIVHEATIERGAYPSPLNYLQFPKSVCTSVNEIICHGIPDFRPLQDGDIVNVDVSVYVNGYHADLNETFFVGNVDADALRLVECSYKCLAAAIDIVKPGTLYRDCGQAISKVAKKFGCSVVTTYCGHGIGTLFHTSPNVPHYANNKAKGTMQVGHVFTIEPMINLGSYRDVTWPDGWTSATVDGSRSAQFEHTMVVTATGCELLTARVGEPVDRIVWDREKFQR